LHLKSSSVRKCGIYDVQG